MSTDGSEKRVGGWVDRWRRRRPSDRPRRGVFSSISLATRLALVAVLVTLISLVVTATVGLIRGNQLADELAEDRVVSVASSQGEAVEVYFRGIGRELAALASTPGAHEAIDELGNAYLELTAEPANASLEADLTEYYLSDVLPALEAARGEAVGAAVVAPGGTAGVYLQRNYTVPQRREDGETIDPALVADPGDGSTYSSIHAEVHQAYGQIALRSGFDDLLLVDARSDVIVYSARKRIDFATSLDLGPLSGSAFARLIDGMAVAPPEAGYAVSDFAAYPPADDRPISFVASPVIDDGDTVGYVVAALTIDPLDAVLSGGGSWSGLGDSGEAYLAGQDGTMRSTARPFQEAPGEFLAASQEPGPGQLTDEQRRLIAATDTTALVQGVNRGVLTLAASGAGTIDTTDYRGVDVLTAYRGIDIAGLDWVIFTDFPTNELNQPIERYARHMLLAVALFVVIITFVAVRWSNRLMAPIRTIANRLRSVRADPGGDHDLVEGQSMPANSPEEYDELALNIDQMLRRLQSHQRSVTERSQERARLLRRFLPAGIAKRSEDGDGEVIDHVRNVTVVVVLLDGVGQLSDQRPEQALRTTLADLVDEADALATELGLERIKITGGMYVAVCGASRPYLDHAPRGVAFALGVADLVNQLSGGALSMRVGVDSGEILVGLAGRSGLVYDAWGSAVEGAEHLANGAPAGGVTVSAAVHRQLPDDFVIAGDGDGDGSEPVVVTARIRDGAGR